jgi:aminoglycoside phosphotransferase (APT) family kinase protein
MKGLREDAMIPNERIEAVTRGLTEAFGVTAVDDVSELTGGHTSSLVFRIVVRGTPYVLKIITRPDDPARHYASMRAAADAGLAPRVWYTNVEDRIAITDFVNAAPLSASEALARFPALLRTLHALPPFGRAPFNTSCTFLLRKGPALDGFLQQCQAANVLSRSDTQEWQARYAELAAVYPDDDAEIVSSHNDVLKPDNFLFDGDRVWLVDWEAAFVNDRYADLAVAANLVVANEGEEVAYLREYFGTMPDRYQRARFHLMQQIAHLFYAMVFLFLGSSAGQPVAQGVGPAPDAGEPIDQRGPVPDYAEFQRRVWAREIDLADRDVKILYGRVHWDRLRHNVRQARYPEALAIVSERARTISRQSART